MALSRSHIGCMCVLWRFEVAKRALATIEPNHGAEGRGAWSGPAVPISNRWPMVNTLKAAAITGTKTGISGIFCAGCQAQIAQPIIGAVAVLVVEQFDWPSAEHYKPR